MNFCEDCGKKLGKQSNYFGTKKCRSCTKITIFINKDDLNVLYHKKKLSIVQIAKKYNCNYVTIYNNLLKYNIRIKTKRETHLGKKRPDQSKRMMGDNNPIFGKKRPLSVRRKISKSRIGKYSGRNAPGFGRKPSYRCSYGHGGRYKNTWMKSSYEIAYAKYLDSKKVKWLYESKAFDLGDTTYRPDFYLPETNEYIEVKGYWTVETKDKFKLFKKMYKNIKITVIQKDYLLKRRIIC